MKKVLGAIKGILVWFLGILVLIFMGVCLAVILPFDWIRYRRSRYFEDRRKKYRFFSGSGICFELYNEIRELDLPIDFLPDPEDDTPENGKFLLGDILIVPSTDSLSMGEEGWRILYDGDEECGAALDELLSEEMEQANTIAGKTICRQVVLLTDGENFADHLEFARTDARFLIYDGDCGAILRKFCVMNSSHNIQ